MNDRITKKDLNKCWCGEYCEGHCPPPWSKTKTTDAMTEQKAMKMLLPDQMRGLTFHEIGFAMGYLRGIEDERAKVRGLIYAATEAQVAIRDAANVGVPITNAMLGADKQLDEALARYKELK